MEVKVLQTILASLRDAKRFCEQSHKFRLTTNLEVSIAIVEKEIADPSQATLRQRHLDKKGDVLLCVKCGRFTTNRDCDCKPSIADPLLQRLCGICSRRYPDCSCAADGLR